MKKSKMYVQHLFDARDKFRGTIAFNLPPQNLEKDSDEYHAHNVAYAFSFVHKKDRDTFTKRRGFEIATARFNEQLGNRHFPPIIHSVIRSLKEGIIDIIEGDNGSIPEFKQEWLSMVGFMPISWVKVITYSFRKNKLSKNPE